MSGSRPKIVNICPGETTVFHALVDVCVFFGWCLFPVVQVSSIAAHDAAVATGAMPQILLWVCAFEAISSVAVVQMLEGSGRMPGDFGFDPYNLYSKPGMEKKKVR